MVDRLTRAALPALSARGIRVPAADAPPVGIVHLGLGAFHRAHQAVYTDDAGGWGIAGYTQRSAAVRDQLAPQDGLYTVLERGPHAAGPRIVGALRRVGLGAEAPPRIADPAVRIVTLTVTEKGYRATPEGRLDLADADVRADLAGGGARTPVGQLVAGLRRRGGAPLTVLSCDNLAGNGRVLRRLVEDFCAAVPGGAGLLDAVTFPCTMVDRIVPATSAGDLAEVERLLGVADHGAVVAEPFSQWVIEDDFAAGRPRWEEAGATLTADVRPYEAAKLRLLNAAHSLLAYAGALAGHETIAAAMRDPDLAGAARALMVADASPTLAVPAGFDLPAYREQVLQRFANPHIGHRTTQIAADGSQKLPIRLLGTAAERLAAGHEPVWAAFAVGAWMSYVAAGRDRTGRPLPLDDPLAGRLRAAVAGATAPAAIVAALLGVREVFPAGLAEDQVFRALLTDAVARTLPPG